MYMLLYYFVLVLYTFVDATIFHNYYGNDFYYLTRAMNETLSSFDKSRIETKWIEQPLDHFGEDKRSWKMRYFERLDLWKPGKPVYLFLGGEGYACPCHLETGIMYDLAKETNGAMFASEHRYYGKSKPFDEYTTENLKYLSSRQALADIATLLQKIKSSPDFTSSKVVVVGGSYSGNLAAWMKLLYPDLVDAAIASSAPVLAKKDFYEFLEKVSDDFKQYGTPDCWDKLADKFSRYESLLKSDDGIQELKKEENICEDSDMKKKRNQEMFFSVKASLFMFFAKNGSPRVIKTFCESNFTSDFRKFDGPNFIWNERKECFSFDFDDMIADMKKVDWFVAWTYQTCTEFGYFQTTSSDNQPFTKNIPIDLYYLICTKFFGPDFDEARVDRGVLESNKLYGGLKPNVTKVVFVNGDMDPWSKLGVLKDISHDAPAKVISQSSHCKDLYSDRDTDPKQLKEARRYIKNLIKKWIGEGEY